MIQSHQPVAFVPGRRCSPSGSVRSVAAHNHPIDHMSLFEFHNAGEVIRWVTPGGGPHLTGLHFARDEITNFATCRDFRIGRVERKFGAAEIADDVAVMRSSNGFDRQEQHESGDDGPPCNTHRSGSHAHALLRIRVTLADLRHGVALAANRRPPEPAAQTWDVRTNSL